MEAVSDQSSRVESDKYPCNRPAAQLSSRERIITFVVQGCAALPVLFGLVTLIGWAFHLEVLSTVLPGHVSMKPNVALGFVAAGVALSLARMSFFGDPPAALGMRTAVRLLAAFDILAGTLTTIENAFHVDLHVDQLFFRDTVQLIHPGRMSQISALNLILTGSTLLLLTAGRRLRLAAEVAGFLLTSLAFTGIVGYAYGVPVLYGSYRGWNSMAFNTGAGFLILGIGLVLTPRESRLDRLLISSEVGGRLTRRYLLVAVLGPVGLGYLFLQPYANFGQLRMGMALFAVSLAAGAVAITIVVSHSLDRTAQEERRLSKAATEAAKAMEASERELRLVTDRLPVLLAYLDKYGRILRANKTHEEWHGEPPSSIVGKTVREILGDEYWERTALAREAVKSGDAPSFDTIYPTIHGYRHVTITYAPDLDESGAVRGFACMIVDVEERKRAQAALLQAEKLAAVGRLSSSIAHEINNPVDAAMNLIYLARQDVGDEGRELLDLAHSELARVVDITSQTLRFHKQAKTPQRIELSSLISSVLTISEGKIRNAGVRVLQRYRLTRSILGLESDLRQVIINLLTNALDAMQPGDCLYLRVRAAVDHKTGRTGAAMTIADTGSGMTRETQEHLFDAFFTTKGFEGTGLGLWIASEIISRHGGTIQVRSSRNPCHHGTVFVIFLPELEEVQSNVPAAPVKELRSLEGSLLQ